MLKRPRLLLVVALALVVATTWGVLFANLVLGVYPAHADAIAIPLLEGMIDALFVLGCGLGGLAARGTAVERRVVTGFLAGLAVLLSVVRALQWAHPHHYPIALAYLALAIAVVAPYLPRAPTGAGDGAATPE